MIAHRPISGPGAWKGAEIAADPSWQLRFRDDQVAEMRRAVALWRRQGVTFEEIGPAGDLLTSLAPLVGDIKAAVAGRGFVLLRGFPIDGLSDDEAGMLFWAIGGLFGTGVTQNARGDLLCPVTNRGVQFGYSGAATHERGYQSKAELNFHCDPTDIVALLCVRQAKQGGASRITSTETIYNELLRQRPEHLDRLFAGFIYDRKGENGADEALVTPAIPVFRERGGRISSRYSRSYINAGAARRGVPLTAAEQEALDFFDRTARRGDLVLNMALEPGDIQFLNNYATVHGRSAFEDDPDPAKARFLFRLWLDLGDTAPWNEEDAIMRYAFSRFGNLGLTLPEWQMRRRA